MLYHKYVWNLWTAALEAASSVYIYGWRRADVTLLRRPDSGQTMKTKKQKCEVLQKKMQMQIGWVITHFIYESNNAATFLKWKSISANAF